MNSHSKEAGEEGDNLRRASIGNYHLPLGSRWEELAVDELCFELAVLTKRSPIY